MSTAEGSPPDDGPARSPAAAETWADERYGYKFTTRDETPQEYEGKVRPADEAVPAEEPAPADEAVPARESGPVDPAAELTRPALEGFARQYAASRGLSCLTEGTPAWRDPGPWFLSATDITKSFGLMRGGIGRGRDGELWYAEEAGRGPGGARP